jgi:3-hydroxy-9,10-secoandrosta-1,3,5(10)-triene-9,17-dione monooxygenase
MEALVASGLLRLLQPARFGGHELGFDTLLDTSIEMGRGCASAAWVGSVIASHSWLLALFPEQAQKDVWAETPGTIITASLAPKGKITRVSGGYCLSGAWPFSSGIDHAAWHIVGAVVPPEEEGNLPDIRFSIVPKADFRIENTWFSAGLRGTGSNTAVIESAFVPDHRVLFTGSLIDGEAPGTSVNTAPVYRLPFVAAFNFPLPGPAIGAALGALQDLSDSSRTKLHAYSGKEVVNHVPLHVRLAEAAAELDSAQLLLRRDASESARIVAAGGKLTYLERARSRRDIAYSAVLCSRAMQRILHGSGASNLYDSSPIQRAWRDVNAISTHAFMDWDAASAHYGRTSLGLFPADMFF